MEALNSSQCCFSAPIAVKKKEKKKKKKRNTSVLPMQIHLFLVTQDRGIYFSCAGVLAIDGFYLGQTYFRGFQAIFQKSHKFAFAINFNK